MASDPKWKRRDYCKTCGAYPGEVCTFFNWLEGERFKRSAPCKGRTLMPLVHPKKPKRVRVKREWTNIRWEAYEPCRNCKAPYGTPCIYLDGSGNTKKKPCIGRHLDEQMKESA